MGDFCDSQDADNLITRHSRLNGTEALLGQYLFPFRYSIATVDIHKVGVTPSRSSGKMKYIDTINRLYSLRLPHLDDNSIATFTNDFLAISKVTYLLI